MTHLVNSIIQSHRADAEQDHELLQINQAKREAYKVAYEKLKAAVLERNEQIAALQKSLKATPVRVLTPLLTEPTVDLSLTPSPPEPMPSSLVDEIRQVRQAMTSATDERLHVIKKECDLYKDAYEKLKQKLQEQNGLISQLQKQLETEQKPPEIPASIPPESSENLTNKGDRITSRMQQAQGTKLSEGEASSVFTNLIFLLACEKDIPLDDWEKDLPLPKPGEKVSNPTDSIQKIIDQALIGHEKPGPKHIRDFIKTKVKNSVNSSKKSHNTLSTNIQRQQKGITLAGVNRLSQDVFQKFERFINDLERDTTSSVLVNKSFPCLALDLYALEYRLEDVKELYESLKPTYTKDTKDPNKKKEMEKKITEIEGHLERIDKNLALIQKIRASYFALLKASI
ncbi:MAG TPA: hypothetical protein VHA52_07460 [Candidatus Babeliaceae bacterium]|nr:hypothetical protein [Candidatus Babeliaceae bacterium]